MRLKKFVALVLSAVFLTFAPVQVSAEIVESTIASGFAVDTEIRCPSPKANIKAASVQF